MQISGSGRNIIENNTDQEGGQPSSFCAGAMPEKGRKLNMAIMIGSARIDERGKISGGSAGDQKQKSLTNDTVGEVSMQTMYTHSKGWYIIRPKSVSHAKLIAEKMITACNNINLGYDQGNRLGVIKYGIATATKTECDCGTLVRECIREATGKDPGNFTTVNEAAVLAATGLFEDKIPYVSQTKTPVYNGDILVTRSKGHTVIVVSGSPRSSGSGYTGAFPVLPVRGYYRQGDGITALINCKTQIKYVQRLVNWINGGTITVDGKYGPNTAAAVRLAQKILGVTQDGEFGTKTLNAAKSYRK